MFQLFRFVPPLILRWHRSCWRRQKFCFGDVIMIRSLKWC